MMFLVAATVFFVGLIMFALSFREQHVLPPRARLFNGETIGASLMMLSFWTLLLYLIVEGWKH